MLGFPGARADFLPVESSLQASKNCKLMDMGDMAIQGTSVSLSRTGERTVAPGSEEDKRLKWLESRNREVVAHEQAHVAAAGSAAAGGATFTYEQGPDGKRYATGGEVKIRIASGRTPEETIRNAMQAEKAALAPASPSPQDLRVAASARQMQMQARAELAKEQLGEPDPGMAKANKAYKVAPAPTRGGFEAVG